MDDSLIYHATLGELYDAPGEQDKAADDFMQPRNSLQARRLRTFFEAVSAALAGHDSRRNDRDRIFMRITGCSVAVRKLPIVGGGLVG